MDLLHYFASDYASSREKFLEAASSAGAQVASFDLAASGPAGEGLSTDVAVLGDPFAPATLLVNTATHGVEGLPGSATIIGWLRSGAYLQTPTNVKTVLIHALNPHAFAWTRRVNEDNVDVNRNFIDHGDRYPENPLYERLHSMLVPENLDDETLEKCERALLMYAQTEGMQSVHAAVSRGQFTHPDGLFFGGHQPTWSNRTFCTILAEFVTGTQRLGFVDLHTGPGPYGHASIVCSDLSSPDALERAAGWYGRALDLRAANQVGDGVISGGVANAVRDIALGAEVTSITAKFGTFDNERVFNVLRTDNWTHLHDDLESPGALNLKNELLECYCPQDRHWRELVWVQSRQILGKAVSALSARL